MYQSEDGQKLCRALMALALLTAASESGQKEVMIRLIINLIVEEG